MYRSTTRWTTAVAAAALIALPIAAAAQSTPPQTTPQQPQTQPAPMQPAPTPQTTSPQPPASQPPASGQVDAAAAKQHLSEARDSLSQLTSLPEASKLQGDARTQVSQLISNFNELITTQSNWRAAYSKVDANLTTLLGPDNAPAASGTAAGSSTAGSGTAGAVGTSGSAAAISIDPAIRAKLADVRTHLKQFEQAAGGSSAGESAADSMASAASTGSTANPANPAASNPTANPTQTSAAPPSAAGATGTSGSSASPTATMAASDQAKASEQVGHAEADKHLDAISEILNRSKTGTLTKAQTAELKKHVAELRRLLQQEGR